MLPIQGTLLPPPPPVRYDNPDGVPTVLSNGLGADSVANWFLISENPAAFGLRPDLSDLIVITAMTGKEWPKTIALFEEHILPQFRARKIRYVLAARGGPRKRDGIVVLSDSRATQCLIPAGPFTLDDELRITGTVPNIAGPHRCSQKYKGEVLDTWFEREFGAAGQYRRIMGYDATLHEQGRAQKDRTYTAKRNLQPTAPFCSTLYPLIDQGMDRPKVIDYVKARTGVVWPKSYCTFCPFPGVAASLPDHLRSCAEFPEVAADVRMREYVAAALNPRVLLFGDTSLLRQITSAPYTGMLTVEQVNTILDAFESRLDAASWAVYHVCRVMTKKGTGWRSLTKELRLYSRRVASPRQAAETWLLRYAHQRGLDVETNSVTGTAITRAYVRHRRSSFPASEEFLVAAPDRAKDKARPGFPRAWRNTVRLEALDSRRFASLAA